VAHTLLFNYNIDGNNIKDEHQKFLDEQLIPFLKANKVNIRLHGTASRSGDPEYNKKLSMERVLKIKKYLISQGLTEAQVPGTQMDWVGAAEANPGNIEDGRDRAVRITIENGLKPRPIVVKEPEPPDPPIIIAPIILPDISTTPTPSSNLDPETTEFKIRYVSGEDVTLLGIGTKGTVNAGLGLGASHHTFQIMDPRTGRIKTFELIGPNIGDGVGIKNVPGSVTLPADNPWADLKLAVPMKLGDFSGKPAAFNSVGEGSLSSNRIEFIMPGPGGTHGMAPNAGANVETGFTLGMGMTIVQGAFISR